MIELLALSTAFGFVILIVMLALTLKRVSQLSPLTSNNENDQLIELIEKSQHEAAKGLSELRKEFREINLENRTEISQILKGVQDSLIKLLSENSNSQKSQLDSFSKALNELSEKLINNTNEFRESITKSLYDSDQLSIKKQDEFIEKTNKHFSEFNSMIKTDSIENRKEQSEGLKHFSDTLLKRISENADSHKAQLDTFTKSLAEMSEKLINNSNEFKVGITKFLHDSDQLSIKKQDEFIEKTSKHFAGFSNLIQAGSKDNRTEQSESLKQFSDTMLKRISENANSHKAQLDIFTKSLAELSEKLITSNNDFSEKMAQAFNASDEQSMQKQEAFITKTNRHFADFNEAIKSEAKDNRQELTNSLKTFGNTFDTRGKELREQLQNSFTDLNKQQTEINRLSNEATNQIRQTVEKQLKTLKDDNTAQLGEMRKTVDEKLQSTLEKRLGESFKQVSERLEIVHKGLGEMQNLASGVGDLKKVLSNVKTRGTLGEYQLGNILEQLLTTSQYAVNVATKKGSQAHVEYAIKLPGKEEHEEVWIPIDSKFPLEDYNRLIDAYEEGDPKEISNIQKKLMRTIELFAKDISTKYIDPPHTTDFGIMFLPVEGLFGEVARHPALIEHLQRTYRIAITGPTTLSAFLNSLQMGYRTLAIQKRSSEVWQVLSAVKTEFEKFSDHLTKVHKQMNVATNSIATLKSTRTNAMLRKLASVEVMEPLDAEKVLELPIGTTLIEEESTS